MNINRNKPIYRFYPIHRFIEIMVDKVLVFPSVSIWEDPAEGDVFRCLRKWERELGINWDLNTTCLGWYGNCWTTNQESDALWRIYSPDKFGVKVKVMPDEIDKILSDTSNFIKTNTKLRNNILKMRNTIRYKYQSEIDSEMKDIVSFRNYIYKAESNKQKAQANNIEPITKNNARAAIFYGLTEKRKAFKHEEEFRIVIMMEDVGNVLKINIPDINQLFLEVIFDPRSSDEYYDSYKKVINKLGFNNKIERSSLYYKSK